MRAVKTEYTVVNKSAKTNEVFKSMKAAKAAILAARAADRTNTLLLVRGEWDMLVGYKNDTVYKGENYRLFSRRGRKPKEVKVCEVPTIENVAGDVVAVLEARELIAAKGRLFSENTVDLLKAIGRNGETSAQKAVDKVKCEVCAKGALLFSYIKKYNNYELDTLLRVGTGGYNLENLNKRSQWPAELVVLFGVPLLDAIEMAFERDTYPWTCSQAYRFRDLTYTYDGNLDERMLAIFRDVRDGKFPYLNELRPK